MVGYMGGHTENPTYGDVCSGGTGHAKTVQIIFDPSESHTINYWKPSRNINAIQPPKTIFPM